MDGTRDLIDKEEVARLMDVLRTALRMLGLKNRDIERRLGLTPSYLSRLFGHVIALRVLHVLAIARGMGLQPDEFFALAYPRREVPPSEALRTLQTTLHMMNPPPPAPAGPITFEEIDRRVLESVRRVFKELADEK